MEFTGRTGKESWSGGTWPENGGRSLSGDGGHFSWMIFLDWGRKWVFRSKKLRTNLQGFVTSLQCWVCGSCSLFKSEGWFTRFSRSNGYKSVGSFGVQQWNHGVLSLYPLSNIFNLFLCFHWLIDDVVEPRLSYVDVSSFTKDTIVEKNIHVESWLANWTMTTGPPITRNLNSTIFELSNTIQ